MKLISQFKIFELEPNGFRLGGKNLYVLIFSICKTQCRKKIKFLVIWANRHGCYNNMFDRLFTSEGQPKWEYPKIKS